MLRTISTIRSVFDIARFYAGVNCSCGPGVFDAIHKYSTTILTEEEVVQARRRIFGDPIRRLERSGRRQLSRKLVGADWASWYFFLPPTTPGFHDEEAEYRNKRAANKRKANKANKEEVVDDKKKKKKKK